MESFDKASRRLSIASGIVILFVITGAQLKSDSDLAYFPFMIPDPEAAYPLALVAIGLLIWRLLTVSKSLLDPFIERSHRYLFSTDLVNRQDNANWIGEIHNRAIEWQFESQQRDPNMIEPAFKMVVDQLTDRVSRQIIHPRGGLITNTSQTIRFRRDALDVVWRPMEQESGYQVNWTFQCAEGEPLTLQLNVLLRGRAIELIPNQPNFDITGLRVVWSQGPLTAKLYRLRHFLYEIVLEESVRKLIVPFSLGVWAFALAVQRIGSV